MKNVMLRFCVLLALLTLAYSLYEAQSEEAPAKTPQTAWAESRRLESQIQTEDEEIRQIENEARRIQAAIANYQFIQARNAETMEKLRRWADSE